MNACFGQAIHAKAKQRELMFLRRGWGKAAAVAAAAVESAPTKFTAAVRSVATWSQCYSNCFEFGNICFRNLTNS